MLNRTSFLALAAITSLGVVALASTDASARGGHNFGSRHGNGMKVGTPNVPKPHTPHHTPPIIGKPNTPHHTPPIIGKPNTPHHTPPIIGMPHPHGQWHWRNRYAVGVATVGGVAVVGGATYAAAPSRPAAPACTCLTKEYLPDGSLLFKDVCTNEAAMSAPNMQQAEGPAPQGK